MTTHDRGATTASQRRPAPLRQSVVVAAIILCGVMILVFGVWAYAAPASFGDFIDYLPQNRHLIHDVGAFQIAIGCTTLLALVFSDTVLLALTGFVIGSGLHTVSHYVDRHIGGHDSDVPLLGLFTIIGLCGIAARVPGRKS